MFKVRCRTNLDDYKLRAWPKVMCCRPKKGDAVMDKSGRFRLHVVDVTHAIGGVGILSDSELAGEPYLIVELHKWYDGLDGEGE